MLARRGSASKARPISIKKPRAVSQLQSGESPDYVTQNNWVDKSFNSTMKQSAKNSNTDQSVFQSSDSKKGKTAKPSFNVSEVYRSYFVRQVNGGKQKPSPVRPNIMHPRAVSVIENPQQFIILQKLMGNETAPHS